VRKSFETLGINKGTLETGRSADITIVDLNEEFVVDVNKFKSKARTHLFMVQAEWKCILYLGKRQCCCQRKGAALDIPPKTLQ